MLIEDRSIGERCGRTARRPCQRLGSGLSILLCAAVVFGAARGAASPTGGTGDLIQMSLEELMEVKAESVESASLFEQKRTEAPATGGAVVINTEARRSADLKVSPQLLRLATDADNGKG